MMYLNLWESDESLMPKDPEERSKILASMLEMTKKAVDSGEIKMWGLSPAGGCGFSISERDPKDILAASMKYAPYIKMEIRPMLSLAEVSDVMKEMQS